MPSHRVHRSWADLLGVDQKTAREVDNMIDFPTIYGLKLPHKSIHNIYGLILAYSKYGTDGLLYAITHILLDENYKYWKRWLNI